MGKTKNITLHMQDEERREILIRAAGQGLQLKEYITALIIEDLKRRNGGTNA